MCGLRSSTALEGRLEEIVDDPGTHKHQVLQQLERDQISNCQS
jgi:hypothetical protein